VSDALYQVSDLVKSYGDRRILDGISFEVVRGECLVIMGLSGSGKSVTLRQLNGLEKPDSGTISFDGTDISKLRERELFPFRRQIAMLFQSGALFDSMNVLQNVAFPLREHTDLSDQEIADRVHEKLAMVQLHDIDDRMPPALSGGMRKRVALARSLALDPAAVLYDEPSTGLDPITSATIANLIRSLQQSLQVTSVVVTHDVPLARHVGDRVAFLHEGRFRFIGTWDEADAVEDDLFSDFLAGRGENHVAA